MTDQVKYTNKLQGKNVLVIGGSSGKLQITLSSSNSSFLTPDTQASATVSPKPVSSSAQPSPSPPQTQIASPPPSPNCNPPTLQRNHVCPVTPATWETKQRSKAISPLFSIKQLPTLRTRSTMLSSQPATPLLPSKSQKQTWPSSSKPAWSASSLLCS